MQLTMIVNGHTRTVELPGVSQAIYDATQTLLAESLGGDGVKNREAIIGAFMYLLDRCSGANVSDLWHHIVYRLYCSILLQRGIVSPGQSWVRASGEALELVLERWYTFDLAPYGIKIKALLSNSAKRTALGQMGLSATVGSSKLDITLAVQMPNDDDQIFGGVHVKASLAERVSDDVPTSLEMMRTNHLSPLWTFGCEVIPTSTWESHQPW